jgi:nucleoid DNA-binding protein
MDELILSLLKENGRIILPDFGAFIVKQKTPFTVIFNEFLQYNDGFFIAAVENQFQISKDDAIAKVKNLVSDYNQRLDKGEEINLIGIGIISKTPAGKIILTDTAIKKSAQIKDENVVPQIKTPNVEFDLSDDKQTEKPKPEADKIQEKVIIQEKSKSLIEEQTKHKSEEKPIHIEVTKQVSKVEASKTESKSKPVTPPINDFYNNQPERSKTSIIIWGLVILLVNGAIIGYFIFNNEINTFLNKKSARNTEIVADTLEVAATIADTAQNINPEQNMAIEEPQVNTEDYQQGSEELAGTKYYVVAGVFREEANADKQAKELRDKGFKSEKFGKIGSMFAVSYDVFQSKQEADKYLKKIKDETDPEAWIKIIN